MQVTIQVLNGLERKMSVKLPSANLEEKIEKRLREIAPNAKIPGFRAGKVPFNIIKQRYEDSVRGEVISKVIGSSYQEALKQENIIPAGLPHLTLTESAVGKELEYEAKFEVYPTIQLTNLDNVEIKTKVVKVTEQDLEEMLEKLQKQYAKWEEVDRPAQLGDRVYLDFESRIDGEEFPGGTRKNAVLELGSNAAIPGFETGLIGASIDQHLELTLQFPADYYNKEIAGKTALVKVLVHRILTSELPKLDEEFAATLGVKEGGMEKLRVEVREGMERDAAKKIKEQLNNELTEQFLVANPIDVPNALVEEEAARMEKQVEEQSKAQGRKPQALDRSELLKAAHRRVKLGLLFGEFIKVHGLKLDAARFDTLLDEMSAPYDNPQAIKDVYRNNPEARKQLEAIVMEGQVFDALANQVRKIEREQTFHEWLHKPE